MTSGCHVFLDSLNRDPFHSLRGSDILEECSLLLLKKKKNVSHLGACLMFLYDDSGSAFFI